MLLNVGFLWLWRVLPSRLPVTRRVPRALTLLVVTLSIWVSLAMLFVVGMGQLASAGISVSVLGLSAAFIMLGAGILACARRPPAPAARTSVSVATLMSRGVLAGVAIGVAVWMVKVAGPIAAGVASVFPAIFLTAMVSLSLFMATVCKLAQWADDARLFLCLGLCSVGRLLIPAWLMGGLNGSVGPWGGDDHGACLALAQPTAALSASTHGCCVRKGAHGDRPKASTR